MSQIGFVGLGNMGLPMALNLAKGGHEVTGFDISEKANEAATASSLPISESLENCVADKDVVVTMLPEGSHVKAIYCDDGGILDSVSHALLVDCSTIDVETARQVAASASERGLSMVDAPVSGGVAGATAGTLTFMVGGEERIYTRVEPILAAMGSTIVHAGGAGNGQAAKICNNMMLGIQMISVGEAFVLAEKLGLDHEKLFQISSNASGQCWSLTKYCPVPGPLPASPANNDYRPGFAAAMMLKDLKLAQEAAKQTCSDTQLGAKACQLYEIFAQEGNEGLDFSAIINMIRERSH